MTYDNYSDSQQKIAKIMQSGLVQYTAPLPGWRSMPTHHSNKVTAAQLVDLPVPSHPRLSPSGKHVIYQTASLGQGDHLSSQIWIATTDKDDSATPFLDSGYNDRDPEWCPKPYKHIPNAVAFLSDRARRGKSCAIYLSYAEPNPVIIPLTNARNERVINTFCWSPDGEYIAYTSADEETKEKKDLRAAGDHVNVYGVDLEIRRLRVVQVGDNVSKPLFDFDWANVWSCAWSPDSTKILFTTSRLPELNSPLDGVEFFIVDVASGHLRRVCQFPGRVYDPFCWTASGIYFLAGVKPKKCQTSMKLYKLLPEYSTWQGIGYGEISCAAQIRHLSDSIAVEVKKAQRTSLQCIEGDALGSIVYSGEGEISGWDVRLDPRSENILPVFCGSVFETPLNVFVKAQDQQAYRRLSNHGLSIAASLKDSYEHSTLTARSFDGSTDLEAPFIRPTHVEQNAAVPTFVFIHGGPYMRSANAFDPTMFRWSSMLMAERRYAIMMPNYRGGEGRGEHFASAVRGGLGTVDYDDVIALVEAGIHQGLIDKHRIVIGGWSQGGFMSYLAAVRNGTSQAPRTIPDWQFKGAICGAGICDDDMLMMTSDMPTFQAELAGVAPWQAEQSNVAARQGSAMWQLRAGAKHVPPILILHGEADERVPLSQAIGFHRGCQRHNIPCELVTYPNQPHLMTRRAHIIDMLHRVIRFVDNCLDV